MLSNLRRVAAARLGRGGGGAERGAAMSGAAATDRTRCGAAAWRGAHMTISASFFALVRIVLSLNFFSNAVSCAGAATPRVGRWSAARAGGRLRRHLRQARKLALVVPRDDPLAVRVEDEERLDGGDVSLQRARAER